MQNKVSWLFLTFPSHKHWVIDYWMWLCCCNQVLWEACWRLSLSLLLSTFQEHCLLPAWTLCDLSLARCLSCPVSDIRFPLFPSTSLPFFVFWCKLALEWVNSLCCGEKVSLWRLRRAVPLGISAGNSLDVWYPNVFFLPGLWSSPRTELNPSFLLQPPYVVLIKLQFISFFQSSCFPHLPGGASFNLCAAGRGAQGRFQTGGITPGTLSSFPRAELCSSWTTALCNSLSTNFSSPFLHFPV